jgi:hypothetical protein
MTILARGTFDVNITPQPPEDLTLGRMLIEKKFQGDWNPQATARC